MPHTLTRILRRLRGAPMAVASRPVERIVIAPHCPLFTEAALRERRMAQLRRQLSAPVRA
jgi:hypothetical protein